jgi:hypothetical protein
MLADQLLTLEECGLVILKARDEMHRSKLRQQHWGRRIQQEDTVWIRLCRRLERECENGWRLEEAAALSRMAALRHSGRITVSVTPLAA